MKPFAMLTLAAALVLPAAAATAGTSGRVSPPPLVLSPNLTEPWMLQLKRVAPPPQRSGFSFFGFGGSRQAVPQRIYEPDNRTRTASVHAPRPATTRQPRQIAPEFLPTIVNYDGPYKAGTIVIDTNAKYLYLVQRDGTARRYGVGVGKEGFEWSGTQKISRKAEWPDWRPPAEMRQRRPDLPVFMAGGPENPLGARALYLGSTLYRIHGSNQPWTIGHAVSSGCIRMRNEDVTDLYERVPIGTTVHVI
ncbi:L,D-transpeptidase [Roseibium litorale]|uniref:L,D-transpeptidase n=1 Tax=Roseibium litorale TaxID=2803841 RepID=A0ABR9CRN0_9HYPH|nr:L,D-transpeptidase [Roseibium litorale]MBD8892932.1 L,D-transpeptidase [Roseibium litorale]